MINLTDVEGLIELVNMKRYQPEEYAEFLKGFKEVMSDLMDIAMELAEKN
jgi:hypothetical protein